MTRSGRTRTASAVSAARANKCSRADASLASPQADRYLPRAQQERSSMFVTRLLTVAISLPFVIAALLFLPQPLWALVMFPVLAIASWEWAGLAGHTPALRLAYAATLVISAAALFYLVPRAGGIPVRVDIGIYALG